MSDHLSHLNSGAAELLAAPHDQRIRAILGGRWVEYARAGHMLRILNLLLEHPRTTRMPSIAVYGDSGMGGAGQGSARVARGMPAEGRP